MTDLLLYGNRVRANWGRWVVDCRGSWCFSAMQVWPGDTFTACGDCGDPIPDLIWPPDPEAIEMLLAQRPGVFTRNWEPGETLQQLLQENLTHGILPPDPDVSQQLLTVSGERMVSGTLGRLITSDTRRHQIEAATYGGH